MPIEMAAENLTIANRKERFWTVMNSTIHNVRDIGTLKSKFKYFTRINSVMCFARKLRVGHM